MKNPTLHPAVACACGAYSATALSTIPRILRSVSGSGAWTCFGVSVAMLCCVLVSASVTNLTSVMTSAHFLAIGLRSFSKAEAATGDCAPESAELGVPLPPVSPKRFPYARVEACAASVPAALQTCLPASCPLLGASWRCVPALVAGARAGDVESPAHDHVRAASPPLPAHVQTWRHTGAVIASERVALC